MLVDLLIFGFSVNSYKAVTCFTPVEKEVTGFFIHQPNKMLYMCVDFLPFLSFLTGVQQSS